MTTDNDYDFLPDTSQAEPPVKQPTSRPAECPPGAVDDAIRRAKIDATGILDDMGIDAIFELIADGVSESQICKQLGISNGSMARWLSKDDRSARARDARILSARVNFDKAEEAILDPSLSD